MRMKLTIAMLAAVLTAGLFLTPTLAEEEGVKAQDPELISLRFYADWCGFCRILDATLDEVKAEFEEAPIWFTHVDITDEHTTRQSGFMAAQLGIGDIYEEYGNSTGDMVLIDPSTGEVKDHITHEASKEDLRNRIAAAMGGAAGSGTREGSASR